MEASAEEATGPWQRGMAYKGFSPSVSSLEGVDVARIPSVQEQPVTSVISEPAEGTVVDPDWQVASVRGYAYSGGGRGIVRVDVSADGGKTWTTATLKEGAQQPLNRAWAWTFWEADVPLPEGAEAQGKVEVVCKATDAAYNVQPERLESIWCGDGWGGRSSRRRAIPPIIALLCAGSAVECRGTLRGPEASLLGSLQESEGPEHQRVEQSDAHREAH